MARRVSRFFSALVLIALSRAASAALIVDTGTPVPAAGSGGTSVSSGAFGPTQSVAGEFTTSQAFDITSLSAYVGIYAYSGQATSVTDSFHIGLAAGPADPVDATFDTLFSLPVSFSGEIGPYGNTPTGWASASVQNYLLPAGTYWIVVSAATTDSTLGLGLPSGAPDPLSGYATNGANADGWSTLTVGPNGGPVSIGFQVGAVSPVPLPESVYLLLSGIGALWLLRSRRVAN